MLDLSEWMANFTEAGKFGNVCHSFTIRQYVQVDDLFAEILIT